MIAIQPDFQLSCITNYASEGQNFSCVVFSVMAAESRLLGLSDLLQGTAMLPQ